MEKADLPRDVALAVFYRLAAQQPLDGAHIISKLARLHRRKAHGSPAGVSSAETECDTSRVELVQSGDRVGRDGGDPRRRHGDPGTKAHPLRALRAQGHDHINISINHVGIEQPRLIKAERLGGFALSD